MGAFLGSCARGSYYNITTRSERQDDGNYIIRWQVSPKMDGNVRIYASSGASSYFSKPLVEESIHKEYTKVTPVKIDDPRQYFLMVFGNQETRVASSRILPTISAINFRDFGGYMTNDGEQVRWGALYRSGSLDALNTADANLINRLGIQYQLMLPNTLYPKDTSSTLRDTKSIVIDPDQINNPGNLLQKIYSGELDRLKMAYYRENLLISYAFENPSQFSVALHFLLDPSHYPVLISDELGTRRAAFLVILIQHILGVPLADIMADYELSNHLLPIGKLAPEGYLRDNKVQEALTEYYYSRENDIRSLFYEINRRYGTIDAYLEKCLRFTKEDQEKLRQLLLY